MESMLTVIDRVVEGPQLEVLVFRAAYQPPFGNGQSGDGIEMHGLKGGQDVEIGRVHPSDGVITSAIIKKVIFGSLYYQIDTKVKMS
jgi:hypothetical protein